MAVFLTAVNDTLKRVSVIAGDTQALTTFTDQPQIQHQVDIAIQLWREAINELFSGGFFAKEGATGSITLQADTREYALATDFEAFAGDRAAIRAATDNIVLFEYPGGYPRMMIDQPVATDWLGQPQAFALSIVRAGDTSFSETTDSGDAITDDAGNSVTDDSGNTVVTSDVTTTTVTLTATGSGEARMGVRLDRTPTSEQQGDIYYYLYERTINFTSTMATEQLPFSEETYTALVPVVAQRWEREMKKDFDPDAYAAGLRRAILRARKFQPAVRYGWRRM